MLIFLKILGGGGESQVAPPLNETLCVCVHITVIETRTHMQAHGAREMSIDLINHFP